MKINHKAARKINSHAFKNPDSTVYGIMYGPIENQEITNVLPVSHLSVNASSLHTAFDFSDRYSAKLGNDIGIF